MFEILENSERKRSDVLEKLAKTTKKVSVIRYLKVLIQKSQITL